MYHYKYIYTYICIIINIYIMGSSYINIGPAVQQFPTFIFCGKLWCKYGSTLYTPKLSCVNTTKRINMTRIHLGKLQYFTNLN